MDGGARITINNNMAERVLHEKRTFAIFSRLLRLLLIVTEKLEKLQKRNNKVSLCSSDVSTDKIVREG